MKKKHEWLIWTGCFVLPAVLALLIYVFISERSREPVFDPSPLIGLTKEEVLELAFDQYTKTRDGELVIRVQSINQYGNKSYSTHYYKTLEEAKNDAELMSCDIWQTNPRKKFSISIYQKLEFYAFYFENGNVVGVEIITRRYQ